MWDKRYEPINNRSSLSRELDAFKENQLERDREIETKLETDVEDLFDTKLYNSLKKILTKITKAS